MDTDYYTSYYRRSQCPKLYSSVTFPRECYVTTEQAPDLQHLDQTYDLTGILGLAQGIMSCTAKDGRHVSSTLGVRHSSVVVMMVTHMMTRGILGAGGYRLTTAVLLLIHDRATTVVIVVVVGVVIDVVVAAVDVGTTATAAADVVTAATIVVGRIQRRLPGVV